MTRSVGILGAGLSGLSAAYHLGTNSYVLLESDAQPGGVAASVKYQGFTFDYGPHIIYSKSNYVKELYKLLLGSNLALNGVRKNFILTLGRRIHFPFEANLHDAPIQVREECILGAIRRRAVGANNFRDWILQTFGAGVAKYYMVPYNEKVWKYDLAKMGLDWIADRVVTPSIEDMISGAFRKQKKTYGPNTTFWYPKSGGTGAIANAFASKLSHIRLRERVERIYVKNRILELRTTKKRYEFDSILSSIPLPDLIDMIEDVPSDVTRAARNLIYNSLCCVFVGLKGDNMPNWTAAYVPDKSIIFHRLSFPKNFSPLTVPKGKSSVNIEITCAKNSLPDRKELEGKVLDGLREVGLLNKEVKPLFVKSRMRRYAYVIYDLNHARNVSRIHDFLRERRILPMGRFGEWAYFNTDHAVLSGQKTALEVLTKLKTA